MGKKLKMVLKVSGVAVLCAAMLSSEALAAANSTASGRSMSNFRCNNSTCGGAYLEETSWVGTCTSKSCKEDVYHHWCTICQRNYNICTGGHYIEIY